MRIQEERDRRQRESQILESLPQVFEDLHSALAECVGSYTKVFGAESASIALQPSKITVTTREPGEIEWQTASKVDITAVPAIPGLQIDRGEASMLVEVGLLPGSKVFYRDRELDKYLTMEELTRRILDRAFFPKLPE